LVNIKNRYLTEEIYNSLPDVIKERYCNCYDNTENLKELIDNIIIEVDDILTKKAENSLNNDADRLIRDLITCNNRNIQRQKKRWFKYVKDELKDKNSKNHKYIMREIEVMELLIKEMGTENLKIKDTNELVSIRLQQIENWVSDKNSLMVEFPYLKNLTPKQMLSAFTYDLKNIVYNKLLTDYASNPNAYMVSHPNVLLGMGALFGVPTRIPITVNQRINDNKENEFYYEYNSGDKTIVSIVAKNKNGQTINPVVMHNLDHDDMVLFLSTLSLRKADFIINKKIRVYFRDIIKYLNKPICGKTYDFIRERYEKLFNRQFEVIYTQENKEINHIIRFFQQLKFDIDKKYSDRSYVEVQVSDFIAQQLIDMQTTNMYKNQIMSFTNAVSKLIMFPLQRDRIDCYIYKRDCKKTYPYDYFVSKVIFPSKNNKADNIKMLIEAFEEFKKQNIIINSAKYDSAKETFDIEFIPLSEIEIEDFVYNSNIEKIEN
jgi:hypothetical protein